MTDTPIFDPSFVERALAAGREGKSRAEIAAQLGLGTKALAALEAANKDFAAALDLADAEARAWWDRLPREAVTQGGTFHPTAWAKAVTHRFGSASHRPPAQDKAERPRRREAIFDLPDNGTRRKSRPSGSGR
ncbi:MAG TPA: hypothetical protein VGL58_06360 [Caulobacteraceae bacterium]|jgi:hypothetical protein